MIDTFRGQLRARAWPRKRGKPKSAKTQQHVERFVAVSRALKFGHPDEHAAAIKATKGTPLYTRDLLTMIAYNRAWYLEFQDGRTLYTVAMRQDVSDSLDVLSQRDGDILVRIDGLWRGVPQNQSGANLLSGPDDPTDEQGVEGDFYFNSTAKRLYGPKNAPIEVTPKRYHGVIVDACRSTQIPSCGEMVALVDGSPVAPVSAHLLAAHGSYPASNMIDGNPNSFALSTRNGATPRDIFWLDMGVNVPVDTLRVTRRTDSFGLNESWKDFRTFATNTPPSTSIPSPSDVLGTYLAEDWATELTKDLARVTIWPLALS